MVLRASKPRKVVLPLPVPMAASTVPAGCINTSCRSPVCKVLYEMSVVRTKMTTMGFLPLSPPSAGKAISDPKKLEAAFHFMILISNLDSVPYSSSDFSQYIY